MKRCSGIDKVKTSNGPAGAPLEPRPSDKSKPNSLSEEIPRSEREVTPCNHRIAGVQHSAVRRIRIEIKLAACRQDVAATPARLRRN